jgi:hypothetical protein
MSEANLSNFVSIFKRSYKKPLGEVQAFPRITILYFKLNAPRTMQTKQIA